MLTLQAQRSCPSTHRGVRCGGFLLGEVILAIAVSAVICGSVLMSYVTATRMMAWSANSAAAQAMAVGSLEQAFGAKWNSSVDEMTNRLAPTATNQYVLNGFATNYLTLTDVSLVDPKTRMITVKCVWVFQGKKYTNTVAALRGQNF